MPVNAPDTITSQRGRRMVIAGGGTGGHLFPGIAVAQTFKARHGDNDVLFVNAGRPFEVQVLAKSGWNHEIISIEGIKNRGIWRQLSAGLKIPGAVWAAGRILKSYQPDIVLGVGGYSAGPVVLAAWMLGITTVLHEQNQLPGITNRIVARLVDRIYLSFEDDEKRFKADKVLVTGNPVRDEILTLEEAFPTQEHSEDFIVLVIGGSQGAHAINQAVRDALPRLKDVPGLKIFHQTGLQDEEDIRRSYATSGVKAQVQAFYSTIADQYKQADLIIARAGASTVAEITSMGKAAIFIPFPFAADDHQTHNAQALVSVEAAELISQDMLNGKILAEKILYYEQNRVLLTKMAANARALGKPEAALTIVSDMYALMDKTENGKKPKSGHRQMHHLV